MAPAVQGDHDVVLIHKTFYKPLTSLRKRVSWKQVNRFSPQNTVERTRHIR
jgi:hypothetical protein